MKSNTLLITALVLIVSLACSVNLGTTPAPQAPVVFTQVIVVPGDTSTPLPTDVPPQATNTTAPTLTAPAPTAVPSTQAPAFAVSAKLIKNANCRSGPSQNYKVVTSFTTGEILEVVARNPDFNNTWWQVVIPVTGGKCWISLTTAQATGNFDDLPIIHPPY